MGWFLYFLSDPENIVEWLELSDEMDDNLIGLLYGTIIEIFMGFYISIFWIPSSYFYYMDQKYMWTHGILTNDPRVPRWLSLSPWIQPCLLTGSTTGPTGFGGQPYQNSDSGHGSIGYGNTSGYNYGFFWIQMFVMISGESFWEFLSTIILFLGDSPLFTCDIRFESKPQEFGAFIFHGLAKRREYGGMGTFPTSPAIDPSRLGAVWYQKKSHLWTNHILVIMGADQFFDDTKNDKINWYPGCWG